MADKGMFAGSGFIAGALVGMLIPTLLQRGLAAPDADAVAQRLSASTNGTALQPKHLYNSMGWQAPAGFWVFTITIEPLREHPILAVEIMPHHEPGMVFFQMATIGADRIVEVRFDGNVIATMAPNTVVHIRAPL